jgi:hypothetical protein
MGKILSRRTHAMDEQGRAVWFNPGDTVPGWARKQLTNPKLWGDEQPVKQPPTEAPVPSTSGPGSGKDAWAAFAADRGVEFASGATRDDIMAACQAAGVLDLKE